MTHIRFLDKIIAGYGVGRKIPSHIIKNSGLNARNNPKVFKKDTINYIAKHFEFLFEKNKFNPFTVGRTLRSRIENFIKFSISIKTYKGMRHELKYPVRGQRTHTNAKTTKKQKKDKKRIGVPKIIIEN